MIVFLDFDGVLHPEPSLAKDAFCRLPLIEEILQDFPQVQIVVSSAWRLDWATEAEAVAGLLGHFSHSLRDPWSGSHLTSVTLIPQQHRLAWAPICASGNAWTGCTRTGRLARRT